MPARKYRQAQLEKMNIEVDFETPDMQTSGICRKVREEAVNEHIGYLEFKLLSLSSEKFIQACRIRKVYLDPLCIFWWSDRQLELHNFLTNCYGGVWSFDATGGVVYR